MLKFFTYVKTIARYWRMTQDPRTPPAVRWLIYTGLIHTVSPVKLLPKYTPFVGLLDEEAVLPGVIALSMMMIPKEVKKDHDRQEKKAIETNKAEAHVDAEIKESPDTHIAEAVAESKKAGYLA